MHKQHFAFKHFPFNHALKPDELFESDRTHEAELRLRHLLELRGIGLLTGESGCGKTTLCRQMAAKLPSSTYRICYVSLSTGSVIDSYNIIGASLGLEQFHSRSTAYRAIRRAVSRLVKEAGKYPVLIFDEAHQPPQRHS